MNLTSPTEPQIETVRKRVMIAGVGNIFLKDDGFGSAVIKRINAKEFGEEIEIKDFGIGGLKLAYDLMKGYDALILIDASQRGEEPGTLYVLEPEEKEVESDLEQGGPIDPHGADPATILRFVKALGAWPGRVIIIACEPDTVEDFQIGLSKQVNAAVDKAMELVKEIISEVYSEVKYRT